MMEKKKTDLYVYSVQTQFCGTYMFAFGPATPVLHINICTGQNLIFQRTAKACSGGNYLGDLPVSVNLEQETLSSDYWMVKSSQL